MSSSLDVDSEFANVTVSLRQTVNGPRLEVSDRRTGTKRYLDPLVIEGLAHAADDDLVALVDPSKRWLLEEPHRE